MHLCETAHSHVPCRKQRRIRWLRSRDTVDFTGSEITVGCLIEHSTGTHRDRKLETRTNNNGDRTVNDQERKTKKPDLINNRHRRWAMKVRRKTGHERCCGSRRMPKTKPAKKIWRSHRLPEEKPAKSSLKKPPLARIEARSPGVRAGEETSNHERLSSLSL